MTSNVGTFLDREAASWAALQAQIDRVPKERRGAPGVVDAWSVKDVVWHCAHWARFTAGHLASTGEGRHVDPFDVQPDEHWDRVNAEIAEASAAMSWDEVVAGADRARAEVRAVVDTPGLDAEALAWAADETWIHYDEHAEHVRAFADGLGAGVSSDGGGSW